MGRRRCPPCCDGTAHQTSQSQSQSSSGLFTSASSSSSQGRRSCFPSTTCAGLGDNAPQVMKVVIAGVANGAVCLACGNINGTYYLDNTTHGTFGLTSTCGWSIDLPEICTCAGATGFFRLQVVVGLIGLTRCLHGAIYGIDGASNANPHIDWLKTYSTVPMNCCEFVNESVPYNTVTNCSGTAINPLCIGSASTFLVTSLGCP